MSSQSSYLKEFSKSKSGVAGLAILVVLLALSAYVLTAYPSNIGITWTNPKSWQTNPAKAPPTWISYLGVDVPPTINFPSMSWPNVAEGTGQYNYSSSYTFTWSSSKVPDNFRFEPQFSGSVLEAAITWMKPDGKSVLFYVAAPSSGSSYDISDPTILQWMQQFIQSQTGYPLATVSTAQEMSALFHQDGPALLSNPVLKGTYTVRVDLVASAPVTVDGQATVLTITGSSYGLMGTDLYGRPIELGMLLGLPYALELGAVTSVVGVLFGVIFGGISGFVGGRRDGVMQWFTLVFLALPALPFLIALSYSVSLSLLSEALLIAALSWPFYAIIARSVALSVKQQTYVEADRAMGVPAIRTFFTHFMPRLTPVSIAYTVLGIPAGILLAQTLAFLGIAPGDVVTWGGILNDAFVQQAALFGWWWWVLFPGLMIVVVAVPFVLVGFALDRIVAPRVNAK